MRGMTRGMMWIIFGCAMIVIVAVVVTVIILKPHTTPIIHIEPVVDDCDPSSGPCHAFVFTNNCLYTVWVGSLGNTGMIAPNHGGWRMDPNTEITIYIPKGWGGRFWARTGCDSNGKECATGDCGALQCNGVGGAVNVTVAEFTLDSGQNNDEDYYDVSNVDAYNINMSISLIPGTYVKTTDSLYDCGSPQCSQPVDISQCPKPLQVIDSKGNIVSCLSPCTKIGTDQTCCRGAWNSHDTCLSDAWPSPYNEYPPLVKSACSTQYSYAYDDPTSTFSCHSQSPTTLTGYNITFC